MTAPTDAPCDIHDTPIGPACWSCDAIGQHGRAPACPLTLAPPSWPSLGRSTPDARPLLPSREKVAEGRMRGCARTILNVIRTALAKAGPLILRSAAGASRRIARAILFNITHALLPVSRGAFWLLTVLVCLALLIPIAGLALNLAAAVAGWLIGGAR